MSLGLTLVPVMCWPTFAPASHATEPIHLSLTFIQSNPVTTISVGDRTVQAIVDSGGGALTLSKEVLDSADAVSLGEATVGTDYLGQGHSQPRFRVPIVTIGGQAFQNVTVLQAPQHPPGNGPPVPNGIGRHFLSQYFVVVDYAGASITLWPSNAKTTVSKNCGRTRIPLEHSEEDTELAVSDFDTELGRVRLLWDTGATGSMLPARTAEKLRLATITRGTAHSGKPRCFPQQAMTLDLSNSWCSQPICHETSKDCLVGTSLSVTLYALTISGEQFGSADRSILSFIFRGIYLYPLTIVGGVRERTVGTRRGRERDYSPAALDRAPLGGPSLHR